MASYTTYIFLPRHIAMIQFLLGYVTNTDAMLPEDDLDSATWPALPWRGLEMLTVHLQQIVVLTVMNVITYNTPQRRNLVPEESI